MFVCRSFFESFLRELNRQKTIFIVYFILGYIPTYKSKLHSVLFKKVKLHQPVLVFLIINVALHLMYLISIWLIYTNHRYF